MPDVEDDINVASYKLLCMDCANNLIMDGMSLVKRSQYECYKHANETLSRFLKVLREEPFGYCYLEKETIINFFNHAENQQRIENGHYEKLKRLEERLKKKIEDISEIILEIEGDDSLYNIFDDYYLEMKDLKRILEYLYNDEEI